MTKGTLHPVSSAQDQYRSGSFETLVSRIQNQSTAAGIRTKDFLMAATNRELKDWMEGSESDPDTRLYAMYAIEANRRITFPLTILLYPFVIFPVAATTGRHSKAVAFSSSLLLFVINFVLLSVGSRLAYKGMVPATAGAWFPVIFLLLAGLAIFPAYVFSQLRRPARNGAAAS
jgi:lipopolysaccharide export LptBFGC system permease protein LptF